MAFHFMTNTELVSVFHDVESRVRVRVLYSGMCTVSAPMGAGYAFGTVILTVPEYWTAREVAELLFDFMDTYASGESEGGSARYTEEFSPVWEPVLREIDDLKVLAETGEIAVL